MDMVVVARRNFKTSIRWEASPAVQVGQWQARSRPAAWAASSQAHRVEVPVVRVTQWRLKGQVTLRDSSMPTPLAVPLVVLALELQ
mmetsp:Transcript_598/g.1202  ORF Transcript_598/g.1202 Transcript_598/m.1202 type:complete len:86 (+) Transcript_598:548-805(+)